VLHAVVRISHRFDKRDKHRHVFGATTGNDAIDRHVPDSGLAVIGQERAQHLVGVAVDEVKEGLHPLHRGRDDWQPVAPAILDVETVDVVEAAGKDDVARAGIRALCDRHHRFGEIPDEVIYGRAQHARTQFVRSLYIDVPWHLGERQARIAQPLGGGTGLPKETLAAKR